MKTETQVRRRPRRAAVLTLAAGLVASMWSPLAHAEEQQIFDVGHVDAFNVHVEDGNLALNLKEDITGMHVPRDPESVELHVKSAALADIPEGVPGSPEGYWLPLAQDHNLLWPGWDTLGTQGAGFDPSIDINFVSVDGPGDVHVFSQGAFGGTEALLEGGSMQLTSGSVRRQSYPAHTHAHWVFSDPGVYTIEVSATGTKDGKQQTTDTETYTFTVGDDFRGAAFAPEPTPEPEPEPSEDPEPSTDPDPTTEPAPGPEPEPTDAAEPAPTANPEPTDAAEPAPTADPEPTGASKPDADREPAEEPKPGETPGGSEESDGEADGGQEAAGSDDTQQPVAPGAGEPAPSKEALGECTMSTTIRDATAAEIEKAKRGETTETVQGKPASAAASQGRGVTGSVTVPANTHVHPNWVFTQPGNYAVTIKQSTKSKSGENLSSTATLRFNVGAGGGVNSGHFDFGSQIVDGKLVAKVKDDRQAPAAWVSPTSLSFSLGDAAKATAPAGIEFIAKQGQEVWMIASSQVAGVPWLGANTMHESLLAGSSGDVTFSLVSVEGPGEVGVFTSGNFGKVMDQKWFHTTGGAAKSAQPAKDQPAKKQGENADKPKSEQEAKPGEVFIKDGKHLVKEAKWTYPNGDPCEPAAGMPRSGVNDEGSSSTSLAAMLFLVAAGAGSYGLRRAHS